MSTMVRSTSWLGLAVSLLGLFLALPCWAQDGERPWSGSVTLVSDYRYHGVSLSDGDPALQAELAYESDSGLYGGVFVASVADNGGDDLELDLDLGYGFDVSLFEVAIGAKAYLYPGADDDNYAEGYATVTLSPSEAFRLGAELYYAPEQNDLGTDNTYLAAFAEYALDPVWTVHASIGQEDGFYDDKRDWSLGVTRDFDPWQMGLTWTGFEEAGVSENAVVLSFSRAF